MLPALPAPGTASLFSLALSAFRNFNMGPPMCPIDTPMSCTDGKSAGSSCCVQNPGYLLQAQFWWVNPSIGPADSFTIHGLWYVHYYSLDP